MKYGQKGKWMQKPVTMRMSIATRLIQCVMTKASDALRGNVPNAPCYFTPRGS